MIGEPWVTVGEPWVTVGEPCVTIGEPWVTVGEPCVTIGEPWVTVGEPWSAVGRNHLSRGGDRGGAGLQAQACVVPYAFTARRLLWPLEGGLSARGGGGASTQTSRGPPEAPPMCCMCRVTAAHMTADRQQIHGPGVHGARHQQIRGHPNGRVRAIRVRQSVRRCACAAVPSVAPNLTPKPERVHADVQTDSPKTRRFCAVNVLLDYVSFNNPFF